MRRRKDPDAPPNIAEWEKEFGKYYEDSSDEEDMPFCCQTCGGRDNYPDCTDSCSIFD